MIDQAAVSLQQPLRLAEKLRVLLACTLSGWLFVTVGGMTIQPWDPGAALSLAAHHRVLSGVISGALLSGVVAVMAAVVGPSRLPGFSCLAVAVGWASLNWKGGTLEYLLLYESGAEGDGRRALFGILAAETVYWCALAGAALLIERVVRRWLWRSSEVGPAGGSAALLEPGSVGGLRPRILTATATAAVGAVVVWQFVTPSSVAEIHKGQVYFSILAGFYLGALVGLYFSYRVSPLLFIFSVGLVGVLSFGWAALHPFLEPAEEAYRGLMSAPPFALSRPLPVEYVSLGIIGAVLASWSARSVYEPASDGAK